jgi:tRNA-specific 2-thiouridylase
MNFKKLTPDVILTALKARGQGVVKKIVVGMSGGVDSSVSALLLKEQGYEVTGLFMKNWDEVDERGVCPASEDYEDVLRVCAQLDIPCYAVNFVQEYQERVFAQFLTDLKQGHTPNPDVLCNREIKFQLFLDKALRLGADALATGHYAQIDTMHTLLRGADPGKDQTYFLYTLNTAILRQVLFPIGHLHKSEVRRIAAERGLATAHKRDSTGICFIGKRNFKEFAGRYLGYEKGPIETVEGKVLGHHDGIAFYTLGQRRGLDIGGPGEAWFVARKEPARNALIVVQGEEHPALFASTLEATDLSWVAGEPPGPLPYTCTAHVRYRQEDQACVIESIGQGRALVRFLAPQRALTPRQAVVFYQGARCLGGGLIAP